MELKLLSDHCSLTLLRRLPVRYRIWRARFGPADCVFHRYGQLGSICDSPKPASYHSLQYPTTIWNSMAKVILVHRGPDSRSRSMNYPQLPKPLLITDSSTAPKSVESILLDTVVSHSGKTSSAKWLLRHFVISPRLQTWTFHTNWRTSFSLGLICPALRSPTSSGQ